MADQEIETFYPKSQSEWRAWLQQYHQSRDSIWLVYYKVSTGIPSLTWSEAVDEALCFGWIDSMKKTIDKDRYRQYFSKRKPTSIWSKINKEKVVDLIQNKQMTQAGMDCITIAKQNGSWSFLDDIDNLIVPDDLQSAFDKYKNSFTFYDKQSNSIKKQLLYWVKTAKRAATRNKRINEIAQLAAEESLPKPITS